MSLEWGRRMLMCPPEHFEVSYSINPWMDLSVPVDRDRAWEQWTALVSVLRHAGAQIETLPPQPGLPDLVFTANIGLVDGDRFVPARMRHPQRQPEAAHARAWFEQRGHRIVELAQGPPACGGSAASGFPPGPDLIQEGAGDALPWDGALVAGYRARSSREAYAALEALTGWRVHALELPDPRYYHIDVAFCPLDERRAMIAPAALTRDGARTLTELVPEPVILSDEETRRFCANAVVVEDTVVMPHCTPRLGNQLEAAGFQVVTVDVSEFMKAGGACRCLTLALDVRLAAARDWREGTPRPAAATESAA